MRDVVSNIKAYLKNLTGFSKNGASMQYMSR